jgi:hypothetical protein
MLCRSHLFNIKLNFYLKRIYFVIFLFYFCLYFDIINLLLYCTYILIQNLLKNNKIINFINCIVLHCNTLLHFNTVFSNCNLMFLEILIILFDNIFL